MKEILHGQRPDTPDFVKENREPEWSIRLQKDYLKNVRKSWDQFMDEWTDFIDKKSKNKLINPD